MSVPIAARTISAARSAGTLARRWRVKNRSMLAYSDGHTAAGSLLLAPPACRAVADGR
jgi:hypothetical protein